MSDLKWNVDQVTRFLNIFKTYPCLWDPSHENYNKRDARDVAMKGLVSHLGSEGFGTVHKDQIKIKIKSLKDSYRVELNKVKKSVESGAGVDDIYKPKLAWFSVADSFWRTAMRGRETSSNLDNDHEARESLPHIDNVNEVADLNGEVSTPPPPTNTNKREHSNSRPRALKKIKIEDLTDDESLSDQDHSKNCQEVDDRYDLLGKMVAIKVRGLEKRQRLITEKKINDILFEAEMRHLDHQTRSINNSCSRSPSPSQYATCSPSLFYQFEEVHHSRRFPPSQGVQQIPDPLKEQMSYKSK